MPSNPEYNLWNIRFSGRLSEVILVQIGPTSSSFAGGQDIPGFIRIVEIKKGLDIRAVPQAEFLLPTV